MIITLYDTGLRLNELLNLKLEDIIPGRDIIHVHAGKGKKDRIVPLGSYLKKRLDLYRHLYQPAVYLIECRNGGKCSARGLQSMMSRSLEKSGIRKPATIHTLRHSYATYMLQSGTDPEILKIVLGHKQLRTNRKYFQTTIETILKLGSPLDEIAEIEYYPFNKFVNG